MTKNYEECTKEMEEAREVENVKPKEDSSEGRIPSGKHNNHSKGVLRLHRHNQRVPWTLASEDKSMPMNMTTEINAMPDCGWPGLVPVEQDDSDGRLGGWFGRHKHRDVDRNCRRP
ncbi:hypothetical protein L6164_016731 [Bauhinia variegata]|uniref:Uncharacterized protein n=1 Tax=Bauhinia variegata TaxID=167791 RepID=A0ACB9N7M0_BAUVA|nr:hypothetical protein L6164_016731 [Bauhinia variegata]